MKGYFNVEAIKFINRKGNNSESECAVEVLNKYIQDYLPNCKKIRLTVLNRTYNRAQNLEYL